MTQATSTVVTAGSLAEKYDVSDRQIRRYASLVRTYTGLTVQSPSGDGYTAEAAAEIERGIAIGGHKAYDDRLKAEAAERAAVQAAQAEVIPPASAPEPEGDRPVGVGRLTVLPGGNGAPLAPAPIGDLVLDMPDGMALAPQVPVDNTVQVPSGRPSLASTAGLTSVQRQQVTTQAQLAQLRQGVQQVHQLAGSRLDQLSTEAARSSVLFQQDEAALRQDLAELATMGQLIEETAIQENVREQHRQRCLGKLTDQFTAVAGSLGVGVRRSPSGAESQSDSSSASPQQSPA